MPAYDFQCKACHSVQEEFLRVADLDTSQISCTACGGETQRVILRAPMGMVQSEAHYRCPVTGEAVTSNRQRRYIMDKNNLVDANDFPPERIFEDRRKLRAKIAHDLTAPEREARGEYIESDPEIEAAIREGMQYVEQNPRPAGYEPPVFVEPELPKTAIRETVSRDAA